MNISFIPTVIQDRSQVKTQNYQAHNFIKLLNFMGTLTAKTGIEIRYITYTVCRINTEDKEGHIFVLFYLNKSRHFLLQNVRRKIPGDQP